MDWLEMRDMRAIIVFSGLTFFGLAIGWLCGVLGIPWWIALPAGTALGFALVRDLTSWWKAGRPRDSG